MLLALLAAKNPYLLDWEWGRVERTAVRIVQRIPKGALPSTLPATLHVRIAPTVLLTNAGLRVDAGGRVLYSSSRDAARQRPEITMALPGWLLEANAREPVEIVLTSFGEYGRFHFLLFPVVPPPWGDRASRTGSSEISPSTGVGAGGLDWWAHAGEDAPLGAQTTSLGM
jgi:hypothetical protein